MNKVLAALISTFFAAGAFAADAVKPAASAAVKAEAKADAAKPAASAAAKTEAKADEAKPAASAASGAAKVKKAAKKEKAEEKKA